MGEAMATTVRRRGAKRLLGLREGTTRRNVLTQFTCLAANNSGLATAARPCGIWLGEAGHARHRRARGREARGCRGAVAPA
ncbi:hypothetical protein BOSE62_50004 [Bosea sp. 62]|nr:hypothetical protein BOSE46_110212 [Bosea sp. 46]CAD5258841.1 hypothetical protein BOSE21B_110256 [Bosea sp. 21B]VVT51795.1 hypothetical protein BOS5A_110452 [Bosea sp. EC-HK365B]VXB42834.1 hypothetical protein BOSE29B_110211 [Bosea sp. 29B]VXC55263.1 hypothetical protein BOSE62_50004 [Bosea sp. 62]VXC60177.1 hypothetical protein BOSE125_30299 [Bosea sp. 125]VXC87241.1 hypothetical protein BOSE127_70003 [Bosea sp. 127]